MTDALIKLRILWRWFCSTYGEWKVEIWENDLDSHHCCNGVMCCCGGVTIREVNKL